MKPALATVTGLGAVHAFGRGVDKLWNAALSGEAGCRYGFGRIPRELLAPSTGQTEALSFALLAAREAMELAGWRSETMRPERCGLILGTTTGQASAWESATISYLREGKDAELLADRFRANPLGLLAADLAAALSFLGPRQTIASACCASTEAIGIAAHWIATGKVDRCLVGGVELLCELTISGFRSLQLVSDAPCRPFDAARAGINLSEAAAFLCLEKSGAERALAEIRGFGIAGDAHAHMTAPHPEGDGLARAITGALRMAGLEASEIGWIHGHGTGSRHNDIAESKAVQKIFYPSLPPVTSTKAVHGHALGAAGALESVLVCRALGEQLLLPSHGLENQDPEIGIPVQRKAERRPFRHALKNTLAFGGVNACLAFSAVSK